MHLTVVTLSKTIKRTKAVVGIILHVVLCTDIYCAIVDCQIQSCSEGGRVLDATWLSRCY